MADELELLTASFDADISKFDAKLDRLVGDFDKSSAKVEARNASLVSKLNSQFSAVAGVGAGLVSTAAVGGLLDLVQKSLDAAAAIGDTAKQAGVGVEVLQELRYAASQSGTTFGVLDTGLIALNKNLGEFVNTGAGRAAAAFKQLGIDKLINAGQVRDAAGAFDAIVAKINSVGSEAQKSSLLVKMFGQDAGPQLLQLMERGQTGVAQLEAQAVSLGIVLNTQTVTGAIDANDKLTSLFEVIKAQGVQAVASLAPEIAGLADDITKSLPDLVTWVEKWAEWFGLVKLSPVDAIKVQLQDAVSEVEKLTQQKADNSGWWKNLFGLSNSDFDALIAEAKEKVKKIQDDLAIAPVTVTPATKLDTSSPLHVPQPGAAETALRIADLNKQLGLQLQETVTKADDSYASLVQASNDAMAEMAKGTAAYYDLERQAIIQNAAVDIQKTHDAEYAAIQAIEDRQAAQIASLATLKLSKTEFASESAKINKDAGVEEVNVAVDAADKIEAINIKKNLALIQNDWQYQQSLQNLIQINDEIRTGLTDVGVAGLTSFKAMGQAASQFLLQLAQMITKLYVMQPLLDSLLGPTGTTGGGLLGGLIGSIFGGSGGLSPVAITAANFSAFADGGVFAPGQGRMPLKRFAGGGTSNMAAIFGENGPEAAVPLPDGRTIPVTLRIPQVARAGNQPVVNNFDLRGAVVTQDLLDQMNAISDRNSQVNAQKAVATYDRLALPQRVRKLTGDPRRMY